MKSRYLSTSGTQDCEELLGKVLTSDASGNASWQTPASAGATIQTIRWDKWVEVWLDNTGWVQCNSGWIITSSGSWTSQSDNERPMVRCTRVDPTYSNPAFTVGGGSGIYSITSSANPYN